MRPPDRYAVISKALGGKDERDCASQLRKLLEEIGLSTSLGEQGITPGGYSMDDKELALPFRLQALQIIRKFTEEEIAQLYEKAYSLFVI